MRITTLPAALVSVSLLLAGCTGSTPDVDDSASARSSAATATPDFDVDGRADLVVGIGEATGRVSITYADGRTQDIEPADVRASDSPAFGRALLARDLNGDGVTDLVIGDIGQTDAPAVFLVPGSPSGLDPAKAHGLSAPAGVTGFGAALALAESPVRMLAVGAPGDSGPASPGNSASPSAESAHSGSVGGAVVTWTLDSAGLPSGDPRVLSLDSDGFPGGKAGDAFGATLAATGSWLAIGASRRDVAGARDAGAVYAVDLSTDPWRTHELQQGSNGASGKPQTEARFGFALAAGEGYLAAAAPMADEGGGDAGVVQPFQLTAQGPVATGPISPTSVGASTPAGSLFGMSLAIAHPCEGVAGLVVGAPGTATDGVNASGAAWLTPLGDADCAPRELVEGGALGGSPTEMASLGRAVSAWTSAGGRPDTVVLAAPGNDEEGIPGRVLTLEPPFKGPAQTTLGGIRLQEEGSLTLSPSD